MTVRQLALCLALTPGIGGKSIVRITARNELRNRTPSEFITLSAQTFQEEYGLSQSAALTLKALAQTGFAEFLQQEKRLAGMNVDWVTRIHASYPALVDRFSADAPGVLFMYGNQRLLEANTFAVLSSRSATVEELEQIESLTEVGILNGEVLVSGHNRLEYQRSAIVPLRWGTPRILCADRGLFSVLGQDLKDEAFRAARLWRYEFDPKTDLVVSPFAPDAGSNPASNRQRDALVAALCKRLDFVRISPKGNMESLARTAIRDGRKVRVPAKELERFAGATALERS